jgi:hypothetical protein
MATEVSDKSCCLTCIFDVINLLHFYEKIAPSQEHTHTNNRGTTLSLDFASSISYSINDDEEQSFRVDVLKNGKLDSRIDVDICIEKGRIFWTDNDTVTNINANQIKKIELGKHSLDLKSKLFYLSDDGDVFLTLFLSPFNYVVIETQSLDQCLNVALRIKRACHYAHETNYRQLLADIKNENLEL